MIGHQHDVNYWLFKKSNLPLFTPKIRFENQGDERFSRIRCPLCDWQPTASSVWACSTTTGSPEPLFNGCGTIWNTFATGGQCPGCSHQWRWTSCLHCLGWSLHQDWYAEEE